MRADKNDPAIPTAAKASVAFTFTLPTKAVSVMDNNGSAIPANMAGKANLLMYPNEILGLSVIGKNAKLKLLKRMEVVLREFPKKKKPQLHSRSTGVLN